jgi:7-cyano-7-deazaguanine synthase
VKALCVVSGGMDSVTLLRKIAQKPGAVLGVISFDYGQKHKKELRYAAAAAKRVGVPHYVVKLPLGNLLNSALTTKGREVPEGHYEAPSMKQTVVPNRNMIMLSVAAGVAISIGADTLATAVHAGDHAIYPDCRPEFILAVEQAIRAGNYKKLRVYAPYLRKTKRQIAREGLKMGIDYDKETWSCYKGGAKPCGKCGTCVERLEALA